MQNNKRSLISCYVGTLCNDHYIINAFKLMRCNIPKKRGKSRQKLVKAFAIIIHLPIIPAIRPGYTGRGHRLSEPVTTLIAELAAVLTKLE